MFTKHQITSTVLILFCVAKELPLSYSYYVIHRPFSFSFPLNFPSHTTYQGRTTDCYICKAKTMISTHTRLLGQLEYFFHILLILCSSKFPSIQEILVKHIIWSSSYPNSRYLLLSKMCRKTRNRPASFWKGNRIYIVGFKWQVCSWPLLSSV